MLEADGPIALPSETVKSAAASSWIPAQDGTDLGAKKMRHAATVPISLLIVGFVSRSATAHWDPLQMLIRSCQALAALTQEKRKAYYFEGRGIGARVL